MTFPLPYNPIDFTPTEENIKTVRKLSGNIQNRMQSLKIDYSNFISGNFSNITLEGICFSLSSRDTSISYHLNLLLDVNQEAELCMDPIRINFAVNKKRYLFDSLIFNIVSAIDYSACLAHYILIHKQDYKRPWQRFYKAILCNNDQSIKAFALNAKEINNWFVLLNDYRAELIHYEADNVGHKSVTDWYTCKTKLTVYPPHAFQKKFKLIKLLPNDDNKSIDIVSIWLISSYRRAIDIIVKLLIDYINTNKKGEFHIIRMQND